MVELRQLRWCVCGMLLLATVISYIDRQTISVAAPIIAREYGLNNQQIATILSAFLFAYTFGQLGAGRFVDYIGTKRGLSVSIALWSAATAVTAWAGRAWQFRLCHFLLGAGESATFPAGVRAITEWFPLHQRAFAGGIFTSGASIGAVVVGPLVGSVIHYWGWRTAFLVTGSFGFLWLIAWLLLYDTPERHRMLSFEERMRLQVHSFAPSQAHTLRWIDLLGFRQVWALTIARLLEEPILWLSIFWLPKYMMDVKHLSVLHTGWLLALPFVGLDLGYASGGWISGQLVCRGRSMHTAKLTVMAVAAVFMAGMIPAALSRSVPGFIAGISLATLGHGAWFSNMLTMPSDIGPRHLVGSIYGISALGGGLGGIVSTEWTGIAADRLHSFTPVFFVVGLLPIAATVVLKLLGGSMRELSACSSARFVRSKAP